MKQIFFTVGPSELYPTVNKHLKTGLIENVYSISHRSAYFQQLYSQTVTNLRKLFLVPADYSIFFLSSGTEAMERIVQNTVEKKSFHFVNGAFSKRFYQISVQLYKNATKQEVSAGEGFSVNSIPIARDSELICFTHNETSTGVMIPVEDIYSIKKQNPNALIAVDIVSSVPYVNLDFSRVDCVFFSVQKGFGLPAGLGVLIVSPKAIEKSKHLLQMKQLVGSYHSFLELQRYADKNQTPETPNVLAFYLLNRVTEDIFELGIEKIRANLESRSQKLYSFFEENRKFKLLVGNRNWRSVTTIVSEVMGGSKKLLENLKSKGILISSGYKEMKETHIRIGNYPAHSDEYFEKLINAIKSIS